MEDYGLRYAPTVRANRLLIYLVTYREGGVYTRPGSRDEYITNSGYELTRKFSQRCLGYAM